MKQIILITGSTDGIGKLAALRLAKKGHKIIVHGRSPEKLEHTVLEIMKTSGNGDISSALADLSDFDQVHEMAAGLKDNFNHIDVLINNAGVLKSPNQTNKNGLDIRFAVNYYAPYILTNNLHKVLTKSQGPRIINVSSAAQSPVNLKALAGQVHLSMQEAYAQSKLALIMWSFYLAKQELNYDVITVNPGSLLNTKMAQEAYGRYWSPAEKGAEILTQLAIEEKFANDSGNYFDNDNGHFTKAHADAYDNKKINELIHVTNQVLTSIKEQ